MFFMPQRCLSLNIISFGHLDPNKINFKGRCSEESQITRNLSRDLPGLWTFRPESEKARNRSPPLWINFLKKKRKSRAKFYFGRIIVYLVNLRMISQFICEFFNWCMIWLVKKSLFSLTVWRLACGMMGRSFILLQHCIVRSQEVIMFQPYQKAVCVIIFYELTKWLTVFQNTFLPLFHFQVIANATYPPHSNTYHHVSDRVFFLRRFCRIKVTIIQLACPVRVNI